MGPFWIANLVIITVSVVIFALILGSYARSYSRLKAGSFTSIIAFSTILMVQGIMAIVIYYTLSLKFGSGLAILLLAVNAVSLCGYILLYRALEI